MESEWREARPLRRPVLRACGAGAIPTPNTAHMPSLPWCSSSIVSKLAPAVGICARSTPAAEPTSIARAACANLGSTSKSYSAVMRPSRLFTYRARRRYPSCYDDRRAASSRANLAVFTSSARIVSTRIGPANQSTCENEGEMYTGINSRK